MERAAIVELDGKVLLFGCNAFLSNAYQCDVTDGKHIYHSSEAWLKAEQARVTGQHSLAHKVSCSAYDERPS